MCAIHSAMLSLLYVVWSGGFFVSGAPCGAYMDSVPNTMYGVLVCLSPHAAAAQQSGTKWAVA